MAAKIYTFQGWSTGGGNNDAYEFDLDTGLWTQIADPPFAGVVSSADTFVVQRGGWDGDRWFVCAPTGGLYSYAPSDTSWRQETTGSIFTGTAEDVHYVMCSDGRFVYILSNSNDFRRYDPVSGSLTTLQTPPGSSYSDSIFAVYDGSGSIYASKGGGSPAIIGKYDIATDAWTQTATGAWNTMLNAAFGTWAAFLGGRLWILVQDANTFRAFEYVPSTDTWTTKANDGGSATNVPGHCVGGETTDITIRVWKESQVGARVYNIEDNTWANAPATPFSTAGGTNFSVARVFNPEFEWFLDDDTTPAPSLIDLGDATVGDTLTYEVRVQTPVARAAGVTVTVPNTTSTDAEDVVTICATEGGTYGTSFSTGALTANQMFSVFVKVIPTSQQTLGLSKRFNLKIVPNG
jgi:hypothetical protein